MPRKPIWEPGFEPTIEDRLDLLEMMFNDDLAQLRRRLVAREAAMQPEARARAAAEETKRREEREARRPKHAILTLAEGETDVFSERELDFHIRIAPRERITVREQDVLELLESHHEFAAMVRDKRILVTPV